MRTLITSVLGLSLSFALSSAAWGQTFAPFTAVEDVCPTCTGGPAYDAIELKSGQEVHARVVVENDALYVLEKFGELRAVAHDQVIRVARNPAADRATSYPDQILLKDGIVLVGTIAGDISPTADHFEITTPRTPVPLHTADRSTVAAIYRAGKQVYAAGK